MTDNTYRIKLKIGEKEFEVEGDKDFVEEKYKELMELLIDISPSNQEEKPLESKSELRGTETLVEFVKRKNPKSYNEYAIVIARYYEIEYEKEGYSITKTDLEEAFKNFRDKPRNYTDVLNQCVRNGWMREAEEKLGLKSFNLTGTGASIVNNMPKE